MSLANLPNELLLLIAENLVPKLEHEPPEHLFHLLLTNRHFSVLFAPLLRKVALRDRGHLTALAWAARRGHAPLVRLTLDNGFSTDAATTGGNCFYTPLLWAVDGGNETAVRILLERGAKVNLGVPNFTPLHLATEKGNQAIVKLLLEHQANMELREDVGLTPLLMAQCEKIVELLLDHGADIDARARRSGSAALHLAVTERREPTVRLLLQRGASITQEDDEGRTPRQLASASGSAAIEALLLAKEFEMSCN